MGLGVAISGIQAQFDEGSAQVTGVPTDFMITQGAGFFAVRKADGTTAYTRAGNFGIDARQPARDAVRATWCSTRRAARSSSRRR